MVSGSLSPADKCQIQNENTLKVSKEALSPENPLELPMKSSGSRASDTFGLGCTLDPLPLLAWRYPTLYLGSH